jgi:hypothetical protein
MDRMAAAVLRDRLCLLSRTRADENGAIFRTRPTESGSDALNRKVARLQALLPNAPGMIRTCDLCLRRAALYPLSYGR